MENAVVLPSVYSKALTLRSKNATNIFVNEAYGQYDYMMMGAAWIGLSSLGFGVMGISPRDDVAARSNTAAA